MPDILSGLIERIACRNADIVQYRIKQCGRAYGQAHIKHRKRRKIKCLKSR